MSKPAVAATPAPGMSSRQFAGRILAAMLAGLLALLVMAGTAWWLVIKADGYARWVEHTYEAESKIYRLQTLIERTETARRGYLLSPDRASWRNYEMAAAPVTEAIADLQSFTADNPSQTRRIAELRRPTERLLGMMTELMALVETGDRDRSLRLFQAGRELEPMQQARTVLLSMVEEEQRLLAMRSGEQSAYAQRLLAVVTVGAILIALLSVAAVWTIRRYAADLLKTKDALRRLNAGLEEEVQARTAELVRANEEIQRFAYIVSHDLRSPLVNVMGFTSELEVSFGALKKLADAAEVRAPDILTRDARIAIEQDLPEAIRFIRSSTQKMDRLINAILKLSREGRRTLTPEPIELTALARSAADSLRTVAAARGAEIEVEGELPTLTSDRLAVEQVLSNVMENAVKYTAPNRPGRVVVRGHAELARIVIEVQDNGRGIAPKDHERVFELFRRSGAQDQPGEGIGLAAVRALVHRLGGRIEVTSELDRGATFRLLLPATLTPTLNPAHEATS